MLTRCPYPECGKTFETADAGPKGDWHWQSGACAHCGQAATLRPVEVVDQLQRWHERREAAGQLTGSINHEVAPNTVSVVLEDIRSLWNVGAIFRTSDGAGVSKLFLCGVTGCPPRKEILKTSLGAEESISWEYHIGTVAVLRHMRQAGAQIIGLERTASSLSLFDAVKTGLIRAPLCLVLGNEVTGLSAETLGLCDSVCHLPMRGTKESLNVAVAFGIAIYLIADRIAQV